MLNFDSFLDFERNNPEDLHPFRSRLPPHEIHCCRHRFSGVTLAILAGLVIWHVPSAILKIHYEFQENSVTRVTTDQYVVRKNNAMKDGWGASTDDFLSNKFDCKEFSELAKIQLAAIDCLFSSIINDG